MPKVPRPLTDADLRNAKPKAAPYTLSDGGGLSLLVKPNGSRLWVVRYQLHGKPGAFHPGAYPSVVLARARDDAHWVRRTVREGLNPAQARAEARREAAEAADQTFKVVAERWIARQASRWSEGYKAQIEGIFKNEVYPNIGKVPVHRITTRSMSAWFEALANRSAVQARAAKQHMAAVFEFAATLGLLENLPNPAARLNGLVPTITSTPRAAAADLDTARAVLGAVERVASPMVALAHRFLVLTGARSAEVLGARWCEITDMEGDTPVWVLPAKRMKGGKRLHAVPLAPQAVDVLRAAKALGVGGDLVFALKEGRAIAHSTLLQTYNRASLPVRHVPHGWRSTLSTTLNEKFPQDRQAIDAMLAHTPGNRSASDVSGSESAYNRASFLARRRELATVWAGLILQGAAQAGRLSGLAALAGLEQSAA